MKRGDAWPIAIVTVLAATVALNIVVLTLSHDRNAAAVEPDYYRKAVRWDSTMAEAEASRALGWRIDAELGLDAARDLEISARVIDRAGAPIEDARVVVTAIHNLDATHPRTVSLAAAAGTAYRGRFGPARAGLWELRFDVRRGGASFAETIRLDAPPRSAVAAARGAR